MNDGSPIKQLMIIHYYSFFFFLFWYKKWELIRILRTFHRTITSPCVNVQFKNQSSSNRKVERAIGSYKLIENTCGQYSPSLVINDTFSLISYDNCLSRKKRVNKRKIEGIQNTDYIKVKIMPKSIGRIKRKKEYMYV